MSNTVSQSTLKCSTLYHALVFFYTVIIMENVFIILLCNESVQTISLLCHLGNKTVNKTLIWKVR